MDDKAACTVEDRGDGGSLWVGWRLGGATGMWDTNCPAATKAMKYVAGLPFVDGKPRELHDWLAEIADEFVNDRKFGRLCKTKTIYRIDGQELDRWTVDARPFTASVAEQLRAKFRVAEIWNERVTR